MSASTITIQDGSTLRATALVQIDGNSTLVLTDLQQKISTNSDVPEFLSEYVDLFGKYSVTPLHYGSVNGNFSEIVVAGIPEHPCIDVEVQSTYKQSSLQVSSSAHFFAFKFFAQFFICEGFCLQTNDDKQSQALKLNVLPLLS